MNKKAYESLSPGQKKIMDEHSTPYWAQRITTPWSMWDIAGRDQIAQMPGHTIHRLSAADVAEWKKAAEPIVEAWKQDVKKRFPDLDPVKMLDEFNRLKHAEGFTWRIYD
jgi:TRAP-type C4-dicarboxylate transport system substrate-binding protein